MDKNLAWLVALVVIFGVINIIGFMAVSPDKIDQEALANKVTAQVIQQIPVPEKPQVIDVDALAATVAGKINIPEYVQPEFDSKFVDIWEKEYADEIEELETEAYNVAEIELEKKDYKALERYLESTIENFDELEDVDVKDYNITIVDLGLDEDEDKVATIEFELKVRYTLEEGVDDDFKKYVYATATVVFDEGDYTDEDVELVFA